MKINKYAKRFPFKGTLELTGRCNMDCKMCYIHVDQSRINELGCSELSTDEWKRIVDEIFDVGTINLLITGGEPTIRKDFTELYEYIAKKGFYLTLFTNATTITDDVFDILKKYPPHVIGITLYGVSDDTYKAVCQVNGGFQKAMRGIERLLRLPSKIEIRTTITKDNLHEAEAIERFIKSFGDRVVFNINQTVYKTSRNSIGQPEFVRLSPTQNAKFYIRRFTNMMDAVLDSPDLLASLNRDFDSISNHGMAVNENEAKGPWGCMAGWQNFTVSWSGRMLACQLIDDISVDCKNTSISDAWDNLRELVAAQSINESCLECNNKVYCGVCPAARFCETGSINGNPDYFCELAEVYSELLGGSSKE